jgi:hypothetical protein
MNTSDKKRYKDVKQKELDDAILNAKAEATKILNQKQNFELSLVRNPPID